MRNYNTSYLNTDGGMGGIDFFIELPFLHLN